LRPVVVVICDSSDSQLRALTAKITADSPLAIEYVTSEVKSLTAQKNLAIDHLLAGWSVEFVQILDDDTSPDVCHLETLGNTLRSYPDVVGVSGVTVPLWKPTNRGLFLSLVMRIGGLESRNPGKVTPAGVGIPVNVWDQTVQQAEWIFGCSMWRTGVFVKDRYAADFMGSALCEDVEFSTRIARLGRLLVNPGAHLADANAQEGRPDAWLEDYRFVRNRRRVVRNVWTWRSEPMYVLSIFLILSARARKGRIGLLGLRGVLAGVRDELTRRPLK
jgi:GT2 family glycosyltransferase